MGRRGRGARATATRGETTRGASRACCGRAADAATATPAGGHGPLGQRVGADGERAHRRPHAVRHAPRRRVPCRRARASGSSRAVRGRTTRTPSTSCCPMGSIAARRSRSGPWCRRAQGRSEARTRARASASLRRVRGVPFANLGAAGSGGTPRNGNERTMQWAPTRRVESTLATSSGIVRTYGGRSCRHLFRSAGDVTRTSASAIPSRV